MPNHCYNRVTIYNAQDTDKSCEQIAKLKQIFEDENVFGQIIPEPDWANTPLLTSDNHYGTKYGNDGELPQYIEDGFSRYVFQSTGITDQRWYDWRIQNWDTKWDAFDVSVDDDDPEHLEISFNTVSWFYDEPGCEIAGYL